MKLADMDEYIRVVYGLLHEETVETEIEGKPRKIRFLNPEKALINTKDPIRLHVSAYGPKARALTARHGAAWMCFVDTVDRGCAWLRGDAGKLGRGRPRGGRAVCHRLGARLRVGAGRAGRQPARHGAGRPARRGAAASRG